VSRKGEFSELEKIALLASRFGKPAVGVGIGDDAAVLEGGLVWTIDAQVEDTHFRLDWLDWQDVGWRSFMAAASDLAAMGAMATAALSALVLGPTVTDEALGFLADGQAAAAKALGITIVGGNLARGLETSVTTTLLGRVVKPVLRSGARVGEGVWLAGHVGFAATGMATLAKGVKDPTFAKCVEAWRHPRARVGMPAGTAGIDISDGLARDAAHVANASNVTIAIDSAALRLPPRFDRDPLEYALHGGEDYALLMTSTMPLEGYARIGSVQPRGASAVTVDGEAVDARGFDHFKAS
jgi:thiamine-monophosphate kinase